MFYMAKKIYDRCFDIFVVLLFIGYIIVPFIHNKPTNTEHQETIVLCDTNLVDVGPIVEYASYPYAISSNGKEFIKSHESLRLNAYNDPTPSKMSIGWGHQIQPGENYSTITKELADEIFEKDIERINKSINRVLKNIDKRFKYTQGFIDGLGSLIYNCGEEGVKSTEFYSRLQKCRYDKNNDCINDLDLKFTLAAVKTSKVFCEGHRIRRANEYKLMIQ